MRKQSVLIYLMLSVLFKTAACLTLADSCTKMALKPFTYNDCKKFIGKDNFRSKEELLQIFYNAYFDNSVNNIRMNKTEINHLSKSIKTLFPLKNCNSIESIDSLLLLRFDSPQNVAVPGSFRMAYLQMSPTVVFVLSHAMKNNQKIVRFKIIEGYVNLRLAGLIKMLSKQMVDLDGTELFYTADPVSKTSLIGLNDERIILSKEMKFSRKDNQIVIDINNPRFTEKEDMLVTEDELQFMLIRFKVRGKDSIMYNNDKWIKDSLSNKGIRTLINQVHDDFDKGTPFPDGLVISKNAVYQLEKRKMSLSSGFHRPEKRELN